MTHPSHPKRHGKGPSAAPAREVEQLPQAPAVAPKPTLAQIAARFKDLSEQVSKDKERIVGDISAASATLKGAKDGLLVYTFQEHFGIEYSQAAIMSSARTIFGVIGNHDEAYYAREDRIAAERPLKVMPEKPVRPTLPVPEQASERARAKDTLQYCVAQSARIGAVLLPNLALELLYDDTHDRAALNRHELELRIYRSELIGVIAHNVVTLSNRVKCLDRLALSVPQIFDEFKKAVDIAKARAEAAANFEAAVAEAKASTHWAVRKMPVAAAYFKTGMRTPPEYDHQTAVEQLEAMLGDMNQKNLGSTVTDYLVGLDQVTKWLAANLQKKKPEPVVAAPQPA
jgi:hypothetical protein